VRPRRNRGRLWLLNLRTGNVCLLRSPRQAGRHPGESLLFLLLASRHAPAMTANVLILCTHNSARSVLSEGMLHHLAGKLGRDVRLNCKRR